MTEVQILVSFIAALGLTVSGMGIYIANIHKSNARKSDKNNEEMKALIVQVITKISESSSVIQNNSKIIEAHSEVFYIVKYKFKNENPNSGG
jgi:hypothetical protein